MSLDTRVWRLVGDPLVRGADDGPLAGETVAVKDLYAVAGQRIGAGSPAWLAQAPLESRHAAVVGQLLDAGADLRGIARTDEFAWSLAGTNAHYGSPPNPKAPDRISGGSSSGSASAVSLGHASVGLGTDTGGSIRVPAGYQGLFGIRTTHGLLDRTGLLPLAPTFDAIGWLTRSAELLRRVGEVLLPVAAPSVPPHVHAVPSLLALASPDVAAEVGRLATEQLDWTPELDAWVDAFRVIQAAEAWRAHGSFVADRLDTLNPDVRGRFEHAATVTPDQEAEARTVAERARDEIRDVVGDRVLLIPSAPSVAPSLGDDLDKTRGATLRLTCIAGLGGLPAVSIPLTTTDGLPAGACLLAAPGRDHDLLAAAVELAATADPTGER